jgi:hypothetical protein
VQRNGSVSVDRNRLWVVVHEAKELLADAARFKSGTCGCAASKHYVFLSFTQSRRAATMFSTRGESPMQAASWILGSQLAKKESNGIAAADLRRSTAWQCPRQCHIGIGACHQIRLGGRRLRRSLGGVADECKQASCDTTKTQYKRPEAPPVALGISQVADFRIQNRKCLKSFSVQGFSTFSTTFLYMPCMCTAFVKFFQIFPVF